MPRVRPSPVALLWLCLAVMIVGCDARAQDCPAWAPCGGLRLVSPGDWTISKQVNEVHVLFTASDGGHFATGLTREHVTVRDNGKPVTILDFRDHTNLPLRIALLVDTSESIRKRFRFEQEVVNVFLRQVLRPEADQAMVAGFNTNLQLRQEFSHDFHLLALGISGLRPGGGTGVFDAVGKACQMLVRPEKDVVARVIVLVSDGEDNASRISSREAVAIAQQAEVTVYAIGISGARGNCYYEPSSCLGSGNLKSLARATGGRALFAATAHGLERAFIRLKEELRHRYAVAYRPMEFEANGRFHRIQIKAQKSGKKLKVKARNGYHAYPRAHPLEAVWPPLP
jgi:Ca-activated chloride channel family protein